MSQIAHERARSYCLQRCRSPLQLTASGRNAPGEPLMIVKLGRLEVGPATKLSGTPADKDRQCAGRVQPWGQHDESV